VSFRMVFRDPAATLRHEQVDPQVAAVVDRLKSKLGAELRT
jgi:phenylalanyl-tRNA synthetase beta chain